LDAALMQTLGTNSIRVYHVDASADHSGCMGVFAKAGIYVLVDLDTFSSYILPVSRPQVFCWTRVSCC
jgi:1,3-beta-glucanosyltransferase GAS1